MWIGELRKSWQKDDPFSESGSVESGAGINNEPIITGMKGLILVFLLVFSFISGKTKN